MKAKGWKQVFKFTYLQMIKSKSYIISTVVIGIVMLIMALGLNFLPALLSGSDDDSAGGAEQTQNDELFNVDGLYVFDNTGITPALDFGFMAEYDGGSTDVIMVSANELEATRTQIRENLGGNVLVEINKYANSYDILVSRPESKDVITTESCSAVADKIAGYLWKQHYLSLGVSEDSLENVNFNISSQVTIAGETPKNELASIISSSILPMISSMLLFMFIFIYASFTAQSIAGEKTSRVTETLLTSIRPMAVILGKVLGMGLASLTQFVILIVVSVGTSAVVAPFGMIGELFGSVEVSSPDIQMVKNALDEAFVNFSPMVIVWIILIFILGFLFYSMIAGLFGATVSRMEDFQSAIQPLSLIGLLGFYLAYIAPAFSVATEGFNVIQRVSFYLPISSPFALPSVIISGDMDTLGILLSVLILAAFCVLMLMFVSRVYEAIILHSGNRIKLKTLFKMAKKSK